MDFGELLSGDPKSLEYFQKGTKLAQTVWERYGMKSILNGIGQVSGTRNYYLKEEPTADQDEAIKKKKKGDKKTHQQRLDLINPTEQSVIIRGLKLCEPANHNANSPCCVGFEMQETKSYWPPLLKDEKQEMEALDLFLRFFEDKIKILDEKSN